MQDLYGSLLIIDNIKIIDKNKKCFLKKKGKYYLSFIKQDKELFFAWNQKTGWYHSLLENDIFLFDNKDKALEVFKATHPRGINGNANEVIWQKKPNRFLKWIGWKKEIKIGYYWELRVNQIKKK